MPSSWKRLPALSRFRRRDGAIVFFIIAVGAVLAGVCVMVVTQAESADANNAFQDVFWPQLGRFHSFLQLQLLTLRSVSDSLSLMPENVTLEASDRCDNPAHSRDQMFWIVPVNFEPCLSPVALGSCRIMRPFLQSFSSIYGGISILDRVSNTPAAIAAWEERESVRWGFDVQYHADGYNASIAQPDVWLLSTASSASLVSAAWVGRDVAAFPDIRQMLNNLSAFNCSVGGAPPGGSPVNATARPEDCPTTAPSMQAPTYGNPVAVSTIFANRFGMRTFAFVTTIEPNSTAKVVSVASVIDEYFNDMLTNHTEDAVIRVLDHGGNVVTQGGCPMADALSVLSLSIPITSTVTWNVGIGQCPSYHAKFATWHKWVYMAAILVATLLSLQMFCRMLRNSWVEEDHRQVLAEKQVHSLIVGYVCHEVRNPLHVLKASVESMIATFRAQPQPISGALVSHSSPSAGVLHGSGTTRHISNIDIAGGDGDEDSNERDSVIMDCRTALAQMQVSLVSLDLLRSVVRLDALMLLLYGVRLPEHGERCAGLASHDERQVQADAQAHTHHRRDTDDAATLQGVHER